MSELIQLELIQPNPYQPRLSEDQEHIIQLAESISANGLLQTPLARPVAGGMVQLAFGHSRLAAFKILAEASPSKYSSMPVELRELGDEEMARIAIAENLARKDLSPIEQAMAMKRYRDEFGKTSEQIGEIFGLSDAAVRNKIRLLELPENIRSAFSTGAMSEGAGRELLSLLALPTSMRQAAESQYDNNIKPGKIISDAVNGAMASLIHDRIESLIENYSEDLSKMPWKHDEMILDVEPGTTRVHLPACKDCPSKNNRGKRILCFDKECCRKKLRFWQWRFLGQASSALGYPPIEIEWNGNQYGPEHTSFHGYRGHPNQALQAAIAAKCPNLRIEYAMAEPESGGLKDRGWPEVTLICAKRRGFCTCEKAIEAGVKLPKNTDTEMPAITANELSDVAKAARRQKKANLVQCRELRDRAAYLIGEGLFDKVPGLWKLILVQLSYTYRDKELTETDARFELGKALANRLYDPDSGSDMDPAYALKHYNEALSKAGLASVSVETDEKELQS
jgi:ParB/RepB/Spo0J family partition protein